MRSSAIRVRSPTPPRATDAGSMFTTERFSGTVELTLPSKKSSRSGRFRRSLLPESAAFCGTWGAGGTHFFTAPAAGHWLPQCAARADKNSRTLHHAARLPRAARHAIEATTREQIAHRTSRAAAASAYHCSADCSQTKLPCLRPLPLPGSRAPACTLRAQPMVVMTSPLRDYVDTAELTLPAKNRHYGDDSRDS